MTSPLLDPGLFKLPVPPAPTEEPMEEPMPEPIVAPAISPPPALAAPAVVAPQISIPETPSLPPSQFDPRVIAKAQLVYPEEMQAKATKQLIAQATPSGAWGAAVPGR